MTRFAFAVLPLLVGCAPYEVLDPTASYAGKTLGQRSADWWTWVYETPFTGHPLVDETGSDCATNQPSDVFYLGGTFGGDASRTCTVPKGVPVLVPLVNYSFDNCGVPEEFVVPEEQFGPEIDAFLDSVTGLTLTVDGDALGSTPADFSAHRVDLTSYDYTVPAEDSLYEYFGLDYTGPCGPATSGGYYALIDLAPGEHELSFSVTSPDFSLNVDYALTVE